MKHIFFYRYRLLLLLPGMLDTAVWLQTYRGFLPSCSIWTMGLLAFSATIHGSLPIFLIGSPWCFWLCFIICTYRSILPWSPLSFRWTGWPSSVLFSSRLSSFSVRCRAPKGSSLPLSPWRIVSFSSRTGVFSGTVIVSLVPGLLPRILSRHALDSAPRQFHLVPHVVFGSPGISTFHRSRAHKCPCLNGLLALVVSVDLLRRNSQIRCSFISFLLGL